MAQTFQKRHFYALADALRSVKTSRALVETIADVLGENPRNGLVNRYGNPHFDRGRFVAVALGKPWRMVRYSRCLYDREGKPRECDGCGSIQGRNPSGGSVRSGAPQTAEAAEDAQRFPRVRLPELRPGEHLARIALPLKKPRD